MSSTNTLKKTFEKIISWSETNPELLEEFALEFQEFLDELASQDFFGTERQSDPRGDRRDS